MFLPYNDCAISCLFLNNVYPVMSRIRKVQIDLQLTLPWAAVSHDIKNVNTGQGQGFASLMWQIKIEITKMYKETSEITWKIIFILTILFTRHEGDT